MSRKIICKIVRDFMLTKDPYGFQAHEICKCNYLCHIQNEPENKNYFPKNNNEYIKIRKQIIEDNNFSKRNLLNVKGS